MTQDQLGAALPNPVHAKTVGRWERGGTYPRGQLTALERVLGVRLTNSDDHEAPSAGNPLSEVERMSDDELVAALFRIGAELAHRLPGTERDALTPSGVLGKGLTVTRRSQHEAPAHAPSPAQASGE